MESAGLGRQGHSLTNQTGLGRPFLKLWSASGVTNLGDGFALAAAPLLAASLTRDPVLVAGLTFAQTLPWLLFSLVSGGLVDRLDRKRVMAAAGVLRAALLGTLGVAVFFNVVNLPLLYAVFFLLGTLENLVDTAAVALLPAVVTASQLEPANARLVGTATVANVMIGPPLGGLLFAATPALPLLLSAGTYVLGAGLLIGLRGDYRASLTDRDAASSTSLLREIREGLTWLQRHALLRTLALTLGVMNLTNVAYAAVLVLFAQERLGLGATGYGLLLAAEAVGGVAGSLLVRRVITRLGAGTALRVGLFVEALVPALLALFPSAFFAGTALALFGLHAAVWSVVTASLRQELVPARLLGRVRGAYNLVGSGSMALGAPLGGLLAGRFGLAAPFWFAALAVALLIPLTWHVLNDREVRAAREALLGVTQ